MSKKDLKSVTANLSGLAQAFPTQRPPAAPVALAVVPSTPAPAPADQPTPAPVAPAAAQEREVQVGFVIRASLRKELMKLTAAAGYDTSRSFILAALKDKGLPVTDADLVDRRRRQ